MTLEIGFMLFLLVATLVSFAWEKIPFDLTALTLLAVLLISGILTEGEAFNVFSNPAPITVGAMFLISEALSRCGAIERLAQIMNKLTRLGHRGILLVLLFPVAIISAFINNTPVVVVFLPVVLSLAKTLEISPSKLLIPLSYASIFGGTCTLIGTSTNILVSSMGESRGHDPIGMFEISIVGFPLMLVGILYLFFFSDKLLPKRETLTSILDEDSRREYLTEAYLQKDSPLVGKKVSESNIQKASGLRVLEVVRSGVAYNFLDNLVLKAGDRLVLSCRPSGMAKARAIDGLEIISETGLGLEPIAADEGMMVEGMIAPGSNLVGQTIRETNFRQRYRVVILAIHRRGRNLRDKIETLRLQEGDTLLLMGTDPAIAKLKNGRDILVLDGAEITANDRSHKIPLVIGTIAAVVGSATFGLMPIGAAALIGCVFLLLTGCIKMKEAYSSVQWNILFLIFAMLAMGTALEKTGTSQFIANLFIYPVNMYIPDAWKALVMLAGIYIMTSIMTEILSNNASVVLMATLAFGMVEGLSQSLGVDVSVRPFLIAICIAGSASFATPIGYQTNTYVYGVGGYRFADFLRIGIPLNLIYFILAMLIIPRFWSF